MASLDHLPVLSARLREPELSFVVVTTEDYFLTKMPNSSKKNKKSRQNVQQEYLQESMLAQADIFSQNMESLVSIFVNTPNIARPRIIPTTSIRPPFL